MTKVLGDHIPTASITSFELLYRVTTVYLLQGRRYRKNTVYI